MQNQSKWPEEFDLCGNDFARCPYCGHENYIDHLGFDGNESYEEEECGGCGKTYDVKLVIISTFTSKKIKEACDNETSNK